jgi:hypothetical protein
MEIVEILHNAMVRTSHIIQSLRGEVLPTGSVRTPDQLGLFTESGLSIYDFPSSGEFVGAAGFLGTTAGIAVALASPAVSMNSSLLLNPPPVSF